jgi:membrane protein
VFSLAPLLLIAIGLASLIFGQEGARGGILEQIRNTVGSPAAEAIEGMLQNASGHGSGMTVVGVVTLLIGASGLFVQLQDSLNRIWKVQHVSSGVWGFVRDRLLSFAAVPGTGFLLLVSLILSAVLAALGEFLTPASLPGGVYLWQGVNALVWLGVITLMLALIYKFLPDTHVAWNDVWGAALLTAVLFTVGKYLMGLYLGHSGVTSTFGAAGSLVLILVWVYYSTQIVLFGAEVAHACAVNRGHQPEATRGETPAVRMREPAHAHAHG